MGGLLMFYSPVLACPCQDDSGKSPLHRAGRENAPLSAIGVYLIQTLLYAVPNKTAEVSSTSAVSGLLFRYALI